MKCLGVVSAIIILSAITPLWAQQLDSAKVDFGWLLGDSTVFMELPSVYNNSQAMDSFGRNVKPLPRDETNSLMCKYGMLDSTYKVG